jgi:hypothetical protein
MCSLLPQGRFGVNYTRINQSLRGLTFPFNQPIFLSSNKHARHAVKEPTENIPHLELLLVFLICKEHLLIAFRMLIQARAKSCGESVSTVSCVYFTKDLCVAILSDSVQRDRTI